MFVCPELHWSELMVVMLALFWSGQEDGIQELQDAVGSKVVTDSIPHDLLLEYVEYEIVSYFGEDK
jgi:hypothetical protein